MDELAQLAGAGNTLILDGGERRVYNTDVGGLVWAVGQVAAAPLPRVTILGTGATARSALLAATQLGAQLVTVVARTPARAEALRTLGEELGVTAGNQAVVQRSFRMPTLSFRRSSPEPPMALRRLWRPAPRWSSTSSTTRGRLPLPRPPSEPAARWSAASTCWSARRCCRSS